MMMMSHAHNGSRCCFKPEHTIMVANRRRWIDHTHGRPYGHHHDRCTLEHTHNTSEAHEHFTRTHSRDLPGYMARETESLLKAVVRLLHHQQQHQQEVRV